MLGTWSWPFGGPSTVRQWSAGCARGRRSSGRWWPRSCHRGGPTLATRWRQASACRPPPRTPATGGRPRCTARWRTATARHSCPLFEASPVELFGGKKKKKRQKMKIMWNTGGKIHFWVRKYCRQNIYHMLQRSWSWVGKQTDLLWLLKREINCGNW